MLTRLRNLWAWSAIDPYVLGAETGKALVNAMEARIEPGSIEFPNTTVEDFRAQPTEAATPEELEASINNLLDTEISDKPDGSYTHF